MNSHTLSHLSDDSVVRGLAERCTRERAATAELLAYLAEFDARRLYRVHGVSSTFAYCVRVLGFSEDSACRRIEIARTGRRFPDILRRIADGSLHLTGASLLAGHLTTDHADELLTAAAHKSKSEIEQLLAERFPRADLPTRLVPLVPMHAAPVPPLVPELDDSPAPVRVNVPDPEESPAPARVDVPTLDASPAPERVTVLVPRPRVMPLAAERFGLQATIDREAHDDLRRAQELLRHQVPDGNVSEVLKRALRLLVRTLEKRKCGLADKPRAATAAKRTNPRHVPAHVRREVWRRDGGRCTFVSATGRRCEARGALEFDHEHPVARGGRSTTGNLRLRCRAHNQLEAERVYGEDFMRAKREAGLARGGPPASPRRR